MVTINIRTSFCSIRDAGHLQWLCSSEVNALGRSSLPLKCSPSLSGSPVSAKQTGLSASRGLKSLRFYSIMSEKEEVSVGKGDEKVFVKWNDYYVRFSGPRTAGLEVPASELGSIGILLQRRFLQILIRFFLPGYCGVSGSGLQPCLLRSRWAMAGAGQ